MVNGIVNLGIGQDLASIGKALGSLFQGDFPGFFTHLMNAAPGVGVFLIIFALMKFVSEITIFKSEEHKKYANMFGIGIALIAVMNTRVYTILVNLVGGSFVILLLILFVVFGFIIAFNKIRTHASEGKTDLNNALANEHESSALESKARNEKRATNRLSRRERVSRRNSKKVTKRLRKSSNDSMKLIDQMLLEITNIEDLQSKGESTKSLRQGVASKISSFTSDLSHELKNVNELRNSIKRLEKYDYMGLNLDFKGSNQFKTAFNHLQTTHEGIEGKYDVKKHQDKIKNYLNRAIQLEQRKREFENNMEGKISDLESKIHDVEPHKSNFIHALDSGRISEAKSHLLKIKEDLEAVMRDDDAFSGELDVIRKLDQELDAFHNAEFKLLKKDLNGEEKEDEKVIHDAKSKKSIKSKEELMEKHPHFIRPGGPK